MRNEVLQTRLVVKLLSTRKLTPSDRVGWQRNGNMLASAPYLHHSAKIKQSFDTSTAREN
jgi:hypothetical protein